jgi:hypothetical protein
MARISYRVRNYESAKGSVPQMSLMDTYYKTVDLRTVLKDINIQHKKWGDVWYRFVELSLFEDAKNAVITHGKGEMVTTTVCYIEELADLEYHMQELERRAKQ